MPSTAKWSSTVASIYTAKSCRKGSAYSDKSFCDSSDEEAFSLAGPTTHTIRRPQDDQQQQSTPALQEARQHIQNNLRLAWDSIFERYSQGKHIAAGKDDVFDFGTGEIVEDAGFLDDFVVQDDDETAIFHGRSIEIGDFGLPGAMGMGNLTESSSEDDGDNDEARASLASGDESEGSEPLLNDEDDREHKSGQDNTPTLAAFGHSRRLKRESRTPLSRSASMPESVDLLSSSSDDELSQWDQRARNIAPVSQRYKHLKRTRTEFKEDLKEFIEAESARHAKAETERIKRERTCTPYLPSRSSFSTPKSEEMDSRMFTSYSHSHTSPFVGSAIASTSAHTLDKDQKPRIHIKAESSNPLNRKKSIRATRADPMTPRQRGFSLATSKPSSAKSIISGSYATSAIPLDGHYSNTLLNQAIACEDDSSDDDLAMSTIAHGQITYDHNLTPSIPWSAKGKSRAKIEENVPIDVWSGVELEYDSHLPSPPISRPGSPKKRSFTTSSSATTSSMSTTKQIKLRPVVEIERFSSRPLPSTPKKRLSHPRSSQCHSAPQLPTQLSHSYRPKQSSPLKSCNIRRSSSRNPHTYSVYVSSDSDGNTPIKLLKPKSRTDQAYQEYQSIFDIGNESATSQVSPTPAKRMAFSPELASHAPLSPAALFLPTPPRSFSSTTSSIKRSSSPSKGFARLQLSSIVKSEVLPLQSHGSGTRLSPSRAPHSSHSQDYSPTKAKAGPSSDLPLPLPLPTPPLSSDSTSNATYPSTIKPEFMEDDDFKVPSLPRPRAYLPNHTKCILPESGQKAVKREFQNETDRMSNDSDEDDEILLISPSRPVITLKDRATPSPLGKGFIRSDSRIRCDSAAISSYRRQPSVALWGQHSTTSLARSREEDEDSDDPLGI